MTAKNTTISLKTKEAVEFINITDRVTEFASEAGIENGIINIQCFHTSSAVLVNEDEPLLLQDIKEQLNRLVPQDKDYNHDNFEKRTVNMCPDECDNGHSHCKAIHLPTSVTLNVIGGEIQLGQWQQVFFLELDRARDRKVQIQIFGE